MGLAVAFIIVVEFCERLGYYTFQSTQKSWLQDQGFSNAKSSSLNQIFGLLSYVSCFFGGWMAETRVGRYRTIAGLVVVYVAGCFLAAVAAHPELESVPMYLLGTFVLIALGTGGIKPNVCTFGADQLDPKGPNVDQMRNSFFLYFYLTVNVGCIVAFGFLATVATNGLGSLIPREDSYFGAYTIAACSMAMALLLYLVATPFYRKDSFLTNKGSPPILGLWAKTLWSGRGCWLGKMALVGWALIPVMIAMSVLSAFVENWTTTLLSLALDLICVGCLCVAHRDNAWLGRNEVTQCLDCIPVLLIGNIVFNIQYNTMSSVFYAQACQMDTRLGSGREATQLNGAFFNLGDAFAIIIFTPVIERLLIPGAQQILGRRVTLNMKIYTGIAVGCASQLVAAFLEYGRQAAPTLGIESFCAPLIVGRKTHVPMSGLSAFWMSIPYAMIGIGEVLVNPVLQHTAYEGAPPSMRSFLQAINLFAMGGLPNAFSSALTQVTASFTPNNLDDGNLPVVYYINVAIGVVGCGLYFLFSRWVGGTADDPKNKDAATRELEAGPSAVHMDERSSDSEGTNETSPCEN